MSDSSPYKQYRASVLVLIPVLIIAYFLTRETFLPFITLYGLAFAGFVMLYQQASLDDNIRFYVRLSWVIRILLLFAVPGLSNDFYRFIWDGRMSFLGLNPYMVLPADFFEQGTLQQVGKDAQELYAGMGSLSPHNYTCYPPLNQLFFFLPAALFPQNIIMHMILLRVIIMGADFGVIFWGRKILRKMHLPESRILLYALNPFILLELTANLHFEGVMIFFLLLAFWFLLQQKNYRSALFFALSVSIKLIPLLLLPLLLKRLGQKEMLKYGVLVLLISLFLFIPFLSPGFIGNFMSGIDLYFRKFEFNASIFYIIRWVGFQTYGWNIIQKAGPVLGLVVFAFVLIMAVLRKNQYLPQLFVSMIFALTGYYLLSTTIHPWYLAFPLLLSIFTPYRFIVVWTAMVMLSYLAYSLPVFHEKTWVLGLEYGVVLGFMLGELLPSKYQKNS